MENKKIICFFIMLALLLPIISFATWQIADPYRGTKLERYVTPEFGKTDYPGHYYSNPNYTIHIKKGILMHEVKRIAGEYNWTVKWKAPQEYPVLLETDLAGPSFSEVMNMLLSHYALKAKYDYSHCIMTVYPARGLKS